MNFETFIRYSAFAIGIAAAGWVTLQTSDAEACSPAPCQGGFLVPSDGGQVPVGQRWFIWEPRVWGGGKEPTASDVTLRPVGSSGKEVSVALRKLGGGSWPKRYMIIAEQPLSRGTTYELKTKPMCTRGPSGNKGPLTARFRTTKSVNAPAGNNGLGQLTAGAAQRGQIQVVAGASCSANIDAVQVPIEVSLSSGAKPWQDILMWETVVEGPQGKEIDWNPRSSSVTVHAPGSSWRGRGRDLLYASCEEDRRSGVDGGLEEGTYRVRMQAAIPGRAALWRTDAVSVTLDCDGGGGGDTGLPDSGVDDTGVADIGIADTGIADTGIEDVGMEDTRVDEDSGSSQDTGPVSDAGNDSDVEGIHWSDAADSRVKDEGCSASGSRGPLSPALLVALGLLAGMLRRGRNGRI